MKRAVVLICLGLVAAAPPTRRQVQEAERSQAAQLEMQRAAEARAAAAEAEGARLAAQRVAAAARLREAEEAVQDAAQSMQVLEQRAHDAQQRLAVRAAALGPMLPVAERLSLYPAETLLAVKLPPEQAVRGVLVLAGITRQLEADAADLRTQARELAGLQQALAAEAPRLVAAREAQASQSSALDSQIAAARASRLEAEDAASDAARRAATEAARAEGLRGAIARIEAERQAAEAQAREQAATAARQRRAADEQAARQREAALARPAGPGVGEPHRQLITPVAGTVVRGFGDITEAGAAQGISYRAVAGARVVSPCGGKAVFAGPFRSFGLLLIVDCGGGAHFVLAGLDRLDVQVGRPVQAGEPVGVMAGGGTLYVELRRDGQPVNPAGFLRGRG